MHTKELPKESYDYYELHYTYTSDECYRTQINDSKDEMGVCFKRYRLKETYSHDSYDTLFQETWINPTAYGVFDENEKVPIAVIELEREEWNNRLRITQLLVKEKYRRKGLGKLLIEKAKQTAEKEDYRIIVLETQSCNVPAIDFYRSQGFVFSGTNLHFYSNNDISENEVMLEMAFLF